MDSIEEKLSKIQKSKIHVSEIEWGNALVEEDKCSYIFTIQNYSLLSKQNGEYIQSPSFGMNKNKDMKWYLKVYPKGDKKDSMDYISLYLYKDFVKPAAVTVSLLLAIVDKNNKNKELEDTQIFGSNSGQNDNWGFTKFMDCKELIKRKETLLPDDTLTIFCSFTTGANIQMLSKTVKLKTILEKSHASEIVKLDPKDAINIYEKFYLDGSFSDVTMVVEDNEFKVHKVVLAAESPVFESIFKKDIKTNSITVTDISFEAMQELLNFIYTKKVDNLHNVAHDLIAAADKYGIQDLKIMCEKSLCKNINQENVLKLIVIADENDAQILKKSAAEFIIKNKQVLRNNSDLKEILKVRPHLYELMFWSDL